MIRFLILFLISTLLFGAKVENFRWLKNETYLGFLERLKLPTKELYYNLDKDDQRITEEIRSGVHAQILRSDNNEIEQILIPLTDELQVHISKKSDIYEFEAIPIIAETRTNAFSMTIENSPYYDIIKKTGSKKLAQIFVSSFKNSLNFKADLRSGDKMAMIYEQKYRMDEPFSMPELKAAMIELKGIKHYVYLNDDERYYDENGYEVENVILGNPVLGGRISSYFTKSRFHPILHKWKAHLGVDYAARRGTPVSAAGDGTIVFVGFNSTYGNLIRISHSDEYETRYAHLKSFRNGILKGKTVTKKQIIGYVGTTGRSTGPHLHFELRKEGIAINPLKVVKITTNKLNVKEQKVFAKIKKQYNTTIDEQIDNNVTFEKKKVLEPISYIIIPQG